MARGTNTSTRHKGMSYTKFGYLFIAPFVIVYCLFSLYPLLTTFWYSGTFMQNTNASFWGFSNREVFYDRYLDLTKLYSDFDETGISKSDYNKIRYFFDVQDLADQRDPIDPEGLQAIVDNPEISDATHNIVQQAITDNNISPIASDPSVMEELLAWSSGYQNIGLTIIKSLGTVNDEAIAAASVAESDSDSVDAITVEDIIGSDAYATFLETLQTADFDEGQTLLVNYLANYAGKNSLYEYFAADNVSDDLDKFYYICANLNSPNAVYEGEEGLTNVSAIPVPFINDLYTYLQTNVWSSISEMNSFNEFQSYIDGDKSLHDDQEQLYTDLASLDAMGLIVDQVQLEEQNGVLVQSSDVSKNILAAMRQYIDTNYQPDPVKDLSYLQIGNLNNYLSDTTNSSRAALIRDGINVDQYITFNGDFDVENYLKFKTEIGLADVLTMDKYNALDKARQDKNIEKAQAELAENQDKLDDVQAAYDAACNNENATQAEIDKAYNELRKVEIAISNAESTIKRPDGIFAKADATKSYIFVGLDNFESIFGNKNRFNVVVGAFYTTAVMWVIGFIPQILLALLLSAWFTDTKLKLKGLGVMKALMYLPNVITAATIAIFFRRLFSYSTGDAASAAMKISDFFHNGDKSFRVNFFANPWLTRLIVCFINFWMWYGNTMIVLIAGITSISESLYESAQLDGANSFQTYTKITMPLLRPILLYTLVTSMIGGLQMYDIPFNLNQYPALVSFNGSYIRSTQTVLMYVNNLAFGKSSIKQVGIASAVSIILFIVTTILSILIFFLMRDKDAAAAAKAKRLARKAGGNR